MRILMKYVPGLVAPLFILLLCFNPGAEAMPTQGHPAPGKTVDKADAQPIAEELVVTLDYPRNASWLAEYPQVQGGKGPRLIAKVRVADEKLAGLPMATVDGEPLTLGDFRQALLPSETDEGEVVSAAGENPKELLRRLIDSRVFLAEAREIGLDQLPELTKYVDVFKRHTLRDLLTEKTLASVKEDEEVVERLYRESIKESLIKAVLFDKEEDAKEFVAGIMQGKDFDEEAAKVAADKKGEFKGETTGGEFVPRREMSPEIASAIDLLQNGEVSAVIPANKQFAVMQLLGTRFPDNPHAKAEARTKAVNFAQNMALVDFNRALTEKYVSLDRQLFDSLDFVEDMDDLVNDERILAEIKGGQPVTVADVADALKSKYYHGFGRAVEQGKIEKDKITTLNDYIAKQVFVKEALAQGIDQTDEFRVQVRDYENSLVFGAFLKKVLVPKLSLAMDDLRSYYDQHKDKFATPRMLAIRSLVFSDEKDARYALEKLQQGTEFNWLKANSSGQVDGETKGLLKFGGKLVTATSFPADVGRALEKVSAGNSYLYSDDAGHHYVLRVDRVIPSQLQPFENVQEEILKAVYSEKLQKVMQDWGGKLREVYPVEIFVKEFNDTKL